MTDQELAGYLREIGYPEHVIRLGRAGLVARWTKFVEEVERGYRFGLEDYRNDLDLRGLIQLLGLDAEVAELDGRFYAKLTARDQRVWETNSAENPSWDYGYPANSGPQLLKDLKDEGLTG
jgi:hypothetical protein